MNVIFIYICTLTILCESIVALIFLFKYLVRVDTKKYITSDHFLVCTKLLELSCSNYKNLILEPKIQQLRHKYSNLSGGKTKLPPEFHKELNILFTEGANTIITKYVSSDIRDILFAYYDMDGLVMFVTTLLKG